MRLQCGAPSIHRALTELRARGVVRAEYRHLVVSDPDALRAITQPS